MTTTEITMIQRMTPITAPTMIPIEEPPPLSLSLLASVATLESVVVASLVDTNEVVGVTVVVSLVDTIEVVGVTVVVSLIDTIEVVGVTVVVSLVDTGSGEAVTASLTLVDAIEALVAVVV